MVKCVYGAPCSGKSTYVKEHASEKDVIWDYDAVSCAITLGDTHSDRTEEQKQMMSALRYTFAKHAPEIETETAWFITLRPLPYIRDLLGDEAEYIHMDATREECLKRLEKDDSRKDKQMMKDLINQYFDEEEEKCNMPERKEIRNFNFEVRAQEDEEHGKYIEGRAIVFNEKTDLGWYDEIIDADALKETDLRDVRLLINHNTDMIPLARSRNNNANSTMQLSVDENGMSMRANLDTENNADARSLYSATDRGDISGMSFMFIVDSDKWDDVDSEHPTRTILGIRKVMEVSAVTFPAYEQTTLEARGLAGALESAKASLDSARDELRKREAQKRKIRILTEVM